MPSRHRYPCRSRAAGAPVRACAAMLAIGLSLPVAAPAAARVQPGDYVPVGSPYVQPAGTAPRPLAPHHPLASVSTRLPVTLGPTPPQPYCSDIPAVGPPGSAFRGARAGESVACIVPTWGSGSEDQEFRRVDRIIDHRPVLSNYPLWRQLYYPGVQCGARACRVTVTGDAIAASPAIPNFGTAHRTIHGHAEIGFDFLGTDVGTPEAVSLTCQGVDRCSFAVTADIRLPTSSSRIYGLCSANADALPQNLPGDIAVTGCRITEVIRLGTRSCTVRRAVADQQATPARRTRSCRAPRPTRPHGPFRPFDPAPETFDWGTPPGDTPQPQPNPSPAPAPPPARCEHYNQPGCFDFHGGIDSGGDHRGVATGSLRIELGSGGYCEGRQRCEFTNCYVCPHLDTAFPAGATVTATATPSQGSYFARWAQGACSGQGPTCTFTANKNSCIVAQFLLTNPTAPPQSLSNGRCAEDPTGP